MYTKHVHIINSKWSGYISMLVIYYSPSVLVQMGLLWPRISFDSLYNTSMKDLKYNKHYML